MVSSPRDQKPPPILQTYVVVVFVALLFSLLSSHKQKHRTIHCCFRCCCFCRFAFVRCCFFRCSPVFLALLSASLSYVVVVFVALLFSVVSFVVVFVASLSYIVVVFVALMFSLLSSHKQKPLSYHTLLFPLLLFLSIRFRTLLLFLSLSCFPRSPLTNRSRYRTIRCCFLSQTEAPPPRHTRPPPV